MMHKNNFCSGEFMFEVSIGKSHFNLLNPQTNIAL